MASVAAFERRVRSLFDIGMGRVKRAAGELTGRPDFVLDGEAQETQGLRKRRRDGSRARHN